MDRISTLFTIGRPVDPRYPTNLAISIFTGVVIVAGTIFQLVIGEGFVPSLVWGVIAGLSVFVSWAIARELDPDNPYSAFVGSGLVVVGLFVYGLPGLLFSFWVIIYLRIVNRTCGPPATWLDSLSALGLTLFLVFRGFWLVGLAMTGAFLADALLAKTNRKQFVFAGLSLMGTILLTVIPTVNPTAALGTATWIVLGVSTLLMLLVAGTSREVHAVGDINKEPLIPRRVQVAQIFALVVALLVILVDGGEGLEASLPLWAAILGVGLYRVFAVVAGAGPGEP